MLLFFKTSEKLQTLEIDVDEFYPPTDKYLVFAHWECCAYWVSKRMSSQEHHTCPNCNCRVKAHVAFSLVTDAFEFKNYLIVVNAVEKFQAAQVRALSDYLDQKNQIESQMLPSSLSNTPEYPGNNGQFFKSWLFWDIPYPMPEVYGVNKCFRLVGNGNFVPKPNEWVLFN
ncbi:Rep_fac-A_C domain-containing protein [Caenorhabditis elegans]|uniref:Rep_fac-A_C domain-containing protein n=1 Tax=Caenorhabditis elegans TaxID=6239 RepID=G5ECX4_CAEEL|nr:Rep_fac-A_C domain-containing protein [Caenorhabditis elegans]NP_507216.3 Rep_fac-A_C domain-containing protein [Caenorhabditis elegans]CAA16431.3 Rep_fac-A_C domain-containing protein [Caenorhabditis elegans]CCQ25675.1 Rep_fac-A_C domain-containing protein [Caenorhabditis elegans]|eukprot:NP_001263908.1 Uncharacterized protein CELE_W06G6.21 [Caenorhabditis elegans]